MEIFGFGQRVDIKHEIYSTGIVTFFNSKGNEKFSIKLKRDDFDQFWTSHGFVTNIMKEYGRENDFWSILGEKLNDKYGVIELQQTEQKEIKQVNKQPKKATIKDIIPEVEIIVDYATIYFKGDKVEIVFTNEKGTHTATLKYRKSWSYRKYIDKIFENSRIKPSWQFRYGWEWVAV